MSKPPPPMTVTKYSSRGSIYANEFGSEIVCEDIPGVSLHFKNGAAAMTELCSDGRFVLSNLRLLFIPPVDASVSKATSMLAWGLQLQDVSYGQITKLKTSIFSSEKEFLVLHTKNQQQLSFRFKSVGGVAPVNVPRVKSRLDEALAVIQAVGVKRSFVPGQQSSMDRRVTLPPLPSQSHTPVPVSSHGRQTSPPRLLQPLPFASTSAFPVRVHSSLVFASFPPLPPCKCCCPCHCTCNFLHLRAPVLVVAPPPFSAASHFLTIPQAIAFAMQNQRLEASKLRSSSLPHSSDAVHLQGSEKIPPSLSSHALGSKVAGGGMAALMSQAQKAREGDLKLVDGASRGGIEQLRASADAIAKIAKKISSLQLGDKQEGDAAVQELLQLGFIDPVTSASAGKRYFDELAMQISAQMGDDVRKLGGAVPLIDLFCAYNHKRPLDPVSPEDFKRACERLSELKDCVLRQRTMSSGAVIMEHVSVHAHARQRQKELAEFAGAKERGGQGVSADELFKSRGERSSFVLALEELKEAEQQGFLLRDDSLQGLRFYPNVWA